MPLPQTGCSTLQRPAKFHTTKQLHNFYVLFWWNLCCGFPLKRSICQDNKFLRRGGFFIQLQDPSFPSSFFSVCLQKFYPALIILLLYHNIDKIHTKYQDQNEAIIPFYELEFFCQYTFISPDRLVGKSRASRILQVILPVRIQERLQFTKDLTSWNKLNG